MRGRGRGVHIPPDTFVGPRGPTRWVSEQWRRAGEEMALEVRGPRSGWLGASAVPSAPLSAPLRILLRLHGQHRVQPHRSALDKELLQDRGHRCHLCPCTFSSLTKSGTQ